MMLNGVELSAAEEQALVDAVSRSGMALFGEIFSTLMAFERAHPRALSVDDVVGATQRALDYFLWEFHGGRQELGPGGDRPTTKPLIDEDELQRLRRREPKRRGSRGFEKPRGPSIGEIAMAEYRAQRAERRRKRRLAGQGVEAQIAAEAATSTCSS